MKRVCTCAARHDRLLQNLGRFIPSFPFRGGSPRRREFAARPGTRTLGIDQRRFYARPGRYAFTL